MSSHNGPRAAAAAPRDSREIEWQLASADLSPVRRWLSEHPQIDGLTLQPASTVEIRDTYFDTDDWRIYRAGYALRIRTEDGRNEVTLKALRSAREDVADRREVTEPLEGEAEPEAILHSTGPVGRRVHAVRGAHRLVPLFEIRTSRERFAVQQADEEGQLGEIALDETVICQPDGSPRTTLKRVEVEAHGASHKPLRGLVRSLRRDCELSTAADSKYSQGLKSAGLAPLPPANLSPTAAHPQMRIEEAVFAGLRRYLAAWYQHEPAARLGDDPEELHDLRVAGRRLEALLRQFHAYLPESLLQIRPILKNLRNVLGQARDLDVALGELNEFLGRLPEAELQAIRPLEEHLHEERNRARERMLETLDSPVVQQAFARLTQVLAHPAAAGSATPVLAVGIAPQLIRARFRKVRKGASRLDEHSSMDAFHAVRSQVKKLRYILEPVAAMYGRTGDEMLRALRRWQEKLGIQQDADVAGRRLKAFVDAPPQATPPETLFLMGRLAEHHASAAHRARAGLPKAYRKVRQRWKKLQAEFPAPTPEPGQVATPEDSQAAGGTAVQARPRKTATRKARTTRRPEKPSPEELPDTSLADAPVSPPESPTDTAN